MQGGGSLKEIALKATVGERGDINKDKDKRGGKGKAREIEVENRERCEKRE